MEKEENNNFFTFGMIKPDGVEHREEIIKMIYAKGLKVYYAKACYLTDNLIEENYSHCIGRDFYPEMKENLKSGPVILMLIYDREGNACKKYREVLGATKSWEADKDTIRGMFGNKKVACKNAAHGSGNPKEADEEIQRFFKNDMIEIIKSVDSEKKKEYEQSMLGKKLSTNKCVYTDSYFEREKIDEIEEKIIFVESQNFETNTITDINGRKYFIDWLINQPANAIINHIMT